MLLYAITDRALLSDNEADRAEQLVLLASKWVAGGINFIQIREKDLAAADFLRLAESVVRAAHSGGSNTQVLINASPETATAIALESGADGVHLSGGLDLDQLTGAIANIHKTWRSRRNAAKPPPISVSCHSTAEVEAARAAGATLALHAPVFEKVLDRTRSEGSGLAALAHACRAGRQPAPQPELPVLALGGVTFENASQCIAAGAAGIAAIRLFLKDWQRLVLDGAANRRSPTVG
jgi:thiamine-phosphate pyrophosphorylase